MSSLHALLLRSHRLKANDCRVILESGITSPSLGKGVTAVIATNEKWNHRLSKKASIAGTDETGRD